MKNSLLATAITLIIFGLIGLLVMALMVEPLIVGGLIVFITMVIMYMLIYKILKDNDKQQS
jgi:membrane protein implicated in regulation of membrane protease activity